MAITRLWFFTLQPNHKATDPAFLSLWTNILELCASYTPAPVSSSSQIQLSLSLKPRRPHHFLLQSVQDENLLVLISSYPSLALCRQADAAYTARYKKDVLAHVRHRALRQLDLEDAEVVPALLDSNGGRGRGSNRERRREGEGEDRDDDSVTVAISIRNPLRTEMAAALSSFESGRRAPVLPPNREISGADVYEMPPVPGGEKPDAFEEQRNEGKRWIRIRRGLPKSDDGVVEMFQLKELLSR
ncbi:hypothetical protein VP1G_07370 [Cytospora mali]|uniref:Uncharacterized protein n=1 Tax=Cytospora mali TaxID=578113 RepID=A0A194V8C6_CYTMA|nr:hypothetical protein VP1G_07370 [Valsa mali var. pyri (nom. inval.)]